MVSIKSQATQNESFDAPIPSWAAGFLTPAGREQVRAAIAQAEAQTSGEIVPMIVRSSASTGHVFSILSCLIVVLLLGAHLIYNLFPNTDRLHPGILIGCFFLSIGTAFLLSRQPWVQRQLTHPRDRAMQVARRAELEFYRAGLNQTKGGTGVLLFVSLMEHQAIVLADRSIAAKLPHDTWASVVQLMIGGIKNTDPAQGLIAAIQQTADLLASSFPRSTDDANELKDYLRIME